MWAAITSVEFIFIVKKIIEILHDKVDPIHRRIAHQMWRTAWATTAATASTGKIKNELGWYFPRRRSRWESKDHQLVSGARGLDENVTSGDYQKYYAGDVQNK